MLGRNGNGTQGGFGYDSTDMAAIKYRLKTLKCDRVIYITDAGQVRATLAISLTIVRTNLQSTDPRFNSRFRPCQM